MLNQRKKKIKNLNFKELIIEETKLAYCMIANRIKTGERLIFIVFVCF